jgi:hypothetical protein
MKLIVYQLLEIKPFFPSVSIIPATTLTKIIKQRYKLKLCLCHKEED